jgi:hypothetical protein
MVVDYAENIINLKKLIHGAEKAMLHQDWETASLNLLESVVELRLLRANIELMKDNDGLPYQTESTHVELQQHQTL